MADQNQTASILRRALEKLGPNGENWRKGDRYQAPAPPCYCALTAIINDQTEDEAAWDAWRTFRYANGISGWEWNDAPSRTWPEVKQAFERAIESLEGK